MFYTVVENTGQEKLIGNHNKKVKIKLFFDRASQAIRAVDNETIVFWEPVTYAYLFQVVATIEEPLCLHCVIRI